MRRRTKRKTNLTRKRKQRPGVPRIAMMISRPRKGARQKRTIAKKKRRRREVRRRQAMTSPAKAERPNPTTEKRRRRAAARRIRARQRRTQVVPAAGALAGNPVENERAKALVESRARSARRSR